LSSTVADHPAPAYIAGVPLVKDGPLIYRWLPGHVTHAVT
jgi:hypothetical protein